MLEGGPVDFITGDHLAELTMFIPSRDRASDPDTGHAKVFPARTRGIRRGRRCGSRRALPGFEARIAGPDTHELPTAGPNEEVQARRAQNMKVYLNKAGATAASFTADGFLCRGGTWKGTAACSWWTGPRT